MIKRIICLLGLIVGLQQTVSEAEPVRSLAELDLLKARASQSKRLVVLFFTSSEKNCADCVIMKRNYFQSRKFMEWVERFGVLGEVDVAVANGTDPKAREETMALMSAAQVRMVPSMVLMKASGHLLNSTLTVRDDPGLMTQNYHEIYLREIDNIIPANEATVSIGKPLPTPLPAGGEIRLADHTPLQLKMISGTPRRYVATINGETFAAGETHKVTVDGRKVALQCLEIRAQSVLVKVEGESKCRELTMREVSREPRMQLAEVVFREHNFSVRLPPDWEWITPPASELLAAARTRDGQKILLIGVEKVPSRARLFGDVSQEWHAGVKLGMVKAGVNIGREQEMIVNGVPFRSFSGSHPAGASGITCTAVAGRKAYVLQVILTGGDAARDLELQSVINSFQPLSPETASPAKGQAGERFSPEAIGNLTSYVLMLIVFVWGVGRLARRLFGPREY